MKKKITKRAYDHALKIIELWEKQKYTPAQLNPFNPLKRAYNFAGGEGSESEYPYD